MGAERAGVLAGYLREDELAEQLGHAARTLARWRALRIGPPYSMNGREIIYDVERARQWLTAGGINSGGRGKKKPATNPKSRTSN
jgi:hypothetical protein